MKRIQQVTGGDCAAASLAMFLGYTQEQYTKFLYDFFRPQYRSGFKHGTKSTWVHKVAYRHGILLAGMEFDKDRPAVLCLPSLNKPWPTLHSVYWDGSRIWDPSAHSWHRKLPLVVIGSLQALED
jgi:hypothetical protein